MLMVMVILGASVAGVSVALAHASVGIEQKS